MSTDMTDKEEVRKAYLAYTRMLDAQGIRYANVYALPIMGTDIWVLYACDRYPAGGSKVVDRQYCDVSKTPYVFEDYI